MQTEQRRSSNAMRVEFDKTWTEAEGDPIAFMADIRRRAIETIAREGHAAYADGHCGSVRAMMRVS